MHSDDALLAAADALLPRQQEEEIQALEAERTRLLRIALAAWELSDEVDALGDGYDRKVMIALDDLLFDIAKADDWDRVRNYLRQALGVDS